MPVAALAGADGLEMLPAASNPETLQLSVVVGGRFMSACDAPVDVPMSSSIRHSLSVVVPVVVSYRLAAESADPIQIMPEQEDEQVAAVEEYSARSFVESRGLVGELRSCTGP